MLKHAQRYQRGLYARTRTRDSSSSVAWPARGSFSIIPAAASSLSPKGRGHRPDRDLATALHGQTNVHVRVHVHTSYADRRARTASSYARAHVRIFSYRVFPCKRVLRRTLFVKAQRNNLYTMSAIRIKHAIVVTIFCDINLATLFFNRKRKDRNVDRNTVIHF